MTITPPKQLDAAVLTNREVAREHYRLSLRAPEIAAAARPGQFVMLRAPLGADPLLPRAFSVYAARPEAGSLDLLYRVVGAGTRAMQRLRPGDTVSLWGPLGNTFTPGSGVGRPRRWVVPRPASASGRLLLVGGGVGVPPLVFLASRLASSGSVAPSPPLALIGAATADYLVGTEDLAAAGAEVRVATDDGTAGRPGFVTGLLEEALAGSREAATVFACGPLPMLAAVARICAAASVPCQLALEAPMACGVGACLGCTVPRTGGGFARVCADGPVFAGTAIDWSAIHE